MVYSWIRVLTSSRARYPWHEKSQRKASSTRFRDCSSCIAYRPIAESCGGSSAYAQLPYHGSSCTITTSSVSAGSGMRYLENTKQKASYDMLVKEATGKCHGPTDVHSGFFARPERLANQAAHWALAVSFQSWQAPVILTPYWLPSSAAAAKGNCQCKGDGGGKRTIKHFLLFFGSDAWSRYSTLGPRLRGPYTVPT